MRVLCRVLGVLTSSYHACPVPRARGLDKQLPRLAPKSAVRAVITMRVGGRWLSPGAGAFGIAPELAPGYCVPNCGFGGNPSVIFGGTLVSEPVYCGGDETSEYGGGGE